MRGHIAADAAIAPHSLAALMERRYRAYVDTQDRVDALYRAEDEWTRKAVLNVAGMGFFSSDRTIAEYAHSIWHSTPVQIPAPGVTD